MENRITTLFGIRYPRHRGRDGVVQRLAAGRRRQRSRRTGADRLRPDDPRTCCANTSANAARPPPAPSSQRAAGLSLYASADGGHRGRARSGGLHLGGSPATWTGRLHDAGCRVAHVVSSSKFALKSRDAGVDAVVAEGFEAGGHNGREETTTMALVPQVRQAVDLPLIAAGGIATGPACWPPSPWAPKGASWEPASR